MAFLMGSRRAPLNIKCPRATSGSAKPALAAFSKYLTTSACVSSCPFMGLQIRKTGIQALKHTFRSVWSRQFIKCKTFERHFCWTVQQTQKRTSQRFRRNVFSLQQSQARSCPVSPFPAPSGRVFSSTTESSSTADPPLPFIPRISPCTSVVRLYSPRKFLVQLRYQCELMS